MNCVHPGTERKPSLLAAQAAKLGVTSEEAEKRTYAPDEPRTVGYCWRKARAGY